MNMDRSYNLLFSRRNCMHLELDFFKHLVEISGKTIFMWVFEDFELYISISLIVIGIICDQLHVK